MSETSSIKDLAQSLGIPAATLRRYLRQHGQFLDIAKDGKVYRISDDSIAILKQIREGYSQGLSSEEVDSRLVDSGAQVKHAVPPIDRRAGGNPMIALAEALSNLENLITERFEQQGELLKNLVEAAAAIQQLDPETQRIERVNARLNEWRMERKLQNEALAIWADLPTSERLMRTGMFKTEENNDKRERFVREYVDKHFEEEIRKMNGV